MIALHTEKQRGSMGLVPAPAELRKHQRIPARETAWIRSSQGVARGRLVDVSSDGAFVATDMDLPPGTDIVLRCYLSATKVPMRIWGRVMQAQDRGSGRMGIGVRFSHLEPDTAVRFQAYLQQRRHLDRWAAQYSI